MVFLHLSPARVLSYMGGRRHEHCAASGACI